MQRYTEAEVAFGDAIVSMEQASGKNHPDLAVARDEIATRYADLGENGLAAEYFRKAAAAVIAGQAAFTANNAAAAAIIHGPTIASPERRSAKAENQRFGFLYQRIASMDFATLIKAEDRPHPDIFRHQIANLAALAKAKPESSTIFGREALVSAQSASQSSAAAAIQQMSQRLAAGEGRLASMIREAQDLRSLLLNRVDSLTDATSSGKQDRAKVDELRGQMENIERRIAQIGADLAREFPGYASVANAKPLGVDDIQKILGSDEALVSFLTDEKQSYVFAITRERFDWKVIPLGAGELAEKKSRPFVAVSMPTRWKTPAEPGQSRCSSISPGRTICTGNYSVRLSRC